MGRPGARELLLARCDFLVEAHLWPIEQRLDFNGWLSNFTCEEMEYAECLLESFLFFSTHVTHELFRAAFRQIGSLIIDVENSSTPTEDWVAFKRSLIVTHVTGEDPKTTDSGLHFARLARQVLGIDESQILSNEQAAEALYFDGPKPIVFVDDFVGSGNQFRDTWGRVHSINKGTHVAFKDLMTLHPFAAFYCPILCTSKGRSQISRLAPEVRVVPAHFLDSSYSVIAPDSLVWPAHLKPSANSFLETASARAGISANWRGFQQMGLLVAFEHSVPDATIPLIYHESQSWKPLVRRT